MVGAAMWSEVAAIYRASKKKKDINWFTEWVCRPPAALFVYLLKNTRITPNQVTFLSAFVCIGAGAMFVFLPGHLWLIAAALVFELSFILDCADGQLARIRKTASQLGHQLDFLMDEIKAMLIFGCVTARLWRESADTDMANVYLLVGLGGMFAVAAGISMTSFMRRPEYGAKPPTADGQPAEVVRHRGPLGAVVWLLETIARTFVHYPAYIWLAAAIDRIDLYFWAYAVVNGLYVLRCSAIILFRLGRFGAAGNSS